MKEIRRFQQKSIREQMWQIILVVICLFVILCIMINAFTQWMLYDNADEYTRITAIRVKDQLELTYEKMENYCLKIGENEKVRLLLKSGYAQMGDYVSDVKEVIANYKILESTIEDIALINDQVKYSTVYSYQDLENFRSRTEGKTFQWMGVIPHSFMDMKNKPDMLVFGGDIYEKGVNLGTVLISLDSDFLALDNSGGTEALFFLLEEGGTARPLNCDKKDAESIAGLWKKNGQPENLRKSSYYIHSWYLEELGCYLIGVLDVRKTDFGYNRVELLAWLCVLLAVAFCILLFVIINDSMIKPLQKLGDTMRQIGELRQRSLKEKLSLGGCAEIAGIGKEFEKMLEELESMNRQIFRTATDLYEMKVKKQEAELAYMRSQIDPHFLYNTLEVVRKMAREKEAPEIERMVMDMGHIFRYSTKGSDIVDLEEEISTVQAYIHIQQMRFQGKIEVFCYVAEDVLHVKVIKMLLQPIVENAIFHGLEPKRGNGGLYIGARREGDILILTVKDDGVGIEQSMLESMQEDLQSENVDTSRHVGILNTNARIRLQYGKDYGVTLESCIGEGTAVTMRLPICEEGKNVSGIDCR